MWFTMYSNFTAEVTSGVFGKSGASEVVCLFWLTDDSRGSGDKSDFRSTDWAEFEFAFGGFAWSRDRW